jgi:MFS family permease
MKSDATPGRYGWVIVVVGALAMVATLPGRTHGLGLITEPLLRDLKLERVTYARINLWATLVGALFCIPAGWVLDRFGLRLSTGVLLVATGASAWALCGLGGSFFPLLGVVTLTRGFGQSALSTASITVVGKWFPRRVGPAMAVYSVLMGILFAGAFKAAGKAIQAYGWRTAWAGLAAAVGIGAALVAFLLLREPGRDPERMAAQSSDRGFTLGQALATPAFWIFGGAASLYGLVSSGMGLFMQSVLQERGFAEDTYYDVQSGTFALAVVGQLLSGWLSARYSIKSLTAAALLLYSAALFLLPWVASPALLWTFAVLVALSGGTITVVFFAVWTQAFGTAHLGRIQAAAQMMTVVASAVGPLIFAEVHRRMQSYSPVLFTLAPIVLLFAVMAGLVRVPGGHPESPSPVLESSPEGAAS